MTCAEDEKEEDVQKEQPVSYKVEKKTQLFIGHMEGIK